MTTEKTPKQLTYVQQGTEDFETVHRAGQSYDSNNKEVTRIEMVRDGAGPMGWYDMIYVYVGKDEKLFAALPAHMCNHWKIL